MLRVAAEVLRPLLDAMKHPPFHDERCGLHRNHADSVLEPRQPEPVAADQTGLAVLRLVDDERPYPVAVSRLCGQGALGLDEHEAHLVGPVAEAVANPWMLEL